MNPTQNTTDKLFLMRRIIGLELRLLRTEKKLTLSEAASKSGVSIKNIKLIESGKLNSSKLLKSKKEIV